jgi:hypothetical protein
LQQKTLLVSTLHTISALEDDDCLIAHHLHTSLLDFGRAYCSAFFLENVPATTAGRAASSDKFSI